MSHAGLVYCTVLIGILWLILLCIYARPNVDFRDFKHKLNLIFNFRLINLNIKSLSHEVYFEFSEKNLKKVKFVHVIKLI